MTTEHSHFTNAWQAVLLRYADSPGESALLEAELLGREMLASKLRAAQIAQTHELATAAILASGKLPADAARALSQPLARLLSVCQPALRGDSCFSPEKHRITSNGNGLSSVCQDNALGDWCFLSEKHSTASVGSVIPSVCEAKRSRNLALNSFNARFLESEVSVALLAQSEMRYRLLLEHCHDAIFFLSPTEGRIVSANAHAVSLLGFSRAELLGMTFGDGLVTDTAHYEEFLSAALASGSGRTDSLQLRSKNGERHHTEIVAYLDGEGARATIIMTVRDTTMRIRCAAQFDALSATFSSGTSTEFFAKVVEQITQTLGFDYAYIGELMPGDLQINVLGGYAMGEAVELPLAYDLAGTPCENALGCGVAFIPQGVQACYPDDIALVEMGADAYIGVSLLDSAGKPIGIMNILCRKPIESIGEGRRLIEVYAARVAAELERRRSQRTMRQLSAAIEQAGESIFITDAGGHIEYVNPTFTKVTGYSPDEALGNTPRVIGSGSHDAEFYKNMWTTISSGEVWQGKVQNQRKDGSFYPAKLTIAPLRDEDGAITHYSGIQSDLSALGEMEERFHQLQKMEAIGTMVGGIAHNFNNILAGITGSVYLAKQLVAGHAEVSELLDDVESLSFRAAAMIKQLLSFARKDMVFLSKLSLLACVTNTLALLESTLPAHIPMTSELGDQPLMIQGDATLLHQVLRNLLSNAQDAVEDVQAPCIALTLETITVDAALARTSGLSAPISIGARYARLSVIDNGPGIPSSMLENLYEPFFTTKAPGKGLGLGLSVVYGAVQTHGGFVQVESRCGEGSRFHVYVPLLDTAEEHARRPSLREETVRGHGELILLADDDEVVRRTMERVLKSIGYDVLVAEDGEDAFLKLHKSPQKVALALLDVIMPKCGGLELARRIRKTDGDLPIVFLTGYDKEHALRNQQQPSRCHFLTKPILPAQLGKVIRALLDSNLGLECK